MSNMAHSLILGGQVAEALGLPKDRVMRMEIRFEANDPVRVTAEIFPTQEQIENIIVLVKHSQAAIQTSADVESSVRRITRQVLLGDGSLL